MPIKICVCSDNHGDMQSLETIKNDNPCCDYYFHLGDSHFDEETLRPFISVEGNNDWEGIFPNKRIIELNNHRILLIHGDGYTYAVSGLANKAIHENCDVIMFGHTHEFFDEEYKGIRLINPGSCFHNRDLTTPCYAIVTIEDNGTINVERVNLNR